MKREELLNSREYWIAKIQLDLFNQLKTYMADNNMSQSQLAEKLGVTKGYISQILNGDFDHKISKLVDLSLAIGKVPDLKYSDLNEHVKSEVATSKTAPVFIKITMGEKETQNFSYPNTHSNKHTGIYTKEIA